MRYINLRNIIVKLAVLSLATILFIPCASKRELKQYLNVSVSQTANFTNTQFSQACEHDATTIQQQAEQYSIAKHIIPQEATTDCWNKAYPCTIRNYALTGPTTLAPPHSELYLLHGQFLI